MVMVRAEVRQTQQLDRSPPWPSRHRRHRVPVLGTVSVGRLHTSLISCMWSVGGALAGHRKGLGGRPWGSRGGASGRLRPRPACGRTASYQHTAIVFLSCVHVVVMLVRGTYAGVWLAVGLVVVSHSVCSYPWLALGMATRQAGCW
jgi:hypothetical protein